MKCQRLFYTLVLHLFLVGPAVAQTLPRILIDSTPSGATVYIDSRESGMQGYTAPGFGLRLPRGPHHVILELDGYKPLDKIVNVSQAMKFSFKLEKAPARLDIKAPVTDATARGAEIFIDGSPVGIVPAIAEIPEGRHLMEARKAGFAPYSETIEVKPAESRTLWLTLSPAGKKSGPEPQSAPPPPAATAPLPPQEIPPPPVAAGEGSTIFFASKTPNLGYTVRAGSNICTTPCKMTLAPGPLDISLQGASNFRRNLLIPNAPAQVSIQRFTLSKVIAGSILTALTVPAVITGAVLIEQSVAYGYQYETPWLVVGSVILGHGAAFFIAAIEQFATMKRNRLIIETVATGTSPVP